MWLWSRKGKKYKECTIKGIYMRKAQKKDILDMIQTLHEAHEEIKNHIDRNNIVSAQDLLAQCQECAVSIGNAIETMEKEDCVTIPYIQDYCDFVYQIYEALQNNTDSNANKIYKNLKKQLLRIENSVKNDIPVRKEVVFFPYKASMWDSLESVYLAAKEDPECDAYCVPIPYYDRNPDRSLGQMHYEGNEYPKNIEVIDWQSYNFEERKPDVIYIHNPYDDWNLVTCVHPRFFSSNLKKYTEELVYIPYFILDEIEPDDQPRIDGMKHFIWTPGVINADKVIVQSEKMKQIYVNEYLKAAQENGLQGNHLDRKYLEEKFLGLGSPKIDKVLNTKKEDLEIPEEWLKIIQKPDGSWKKIIFYNTSIAALLENNEKMLEKMKDVFRIFKENKDEVALLWRPHPLIKSTVSSMRPQLWVEYEKLVKWYKEEGWGIYDDTSDVDRAVVLSDAYYGDASSVVQVYRETGKPVMIQNADISGNINCYLTNSWCEKDNYLYFIPHDMNALVKYSIKKMITEWIKPILNGKQEKFALYSDTQNYMNSIFFIPLHGNKILIFDIETEKIEQCDIPKTEKWNCNWGNFSRCYKYENKLYLVGYKYPGLVCIDMAKKQIEKIWEYNNNKSNKTFSSFSWSSCKNGEIIYFFEQNSNQIFSYDIKKQACSSILIRNNEFQKINAITCDNRYLWVINDGKKILRVNLQSLREDVINHPDSEHIPDETLYRYCYMCGERIFCLSTKDAPIIYYDCKENSLSGLIWKGGEKGYQVDYARTDKDNIMFIDLELLGNKAFNMKNNEVREINLKKNQEEINHFIKDTKSLIKEGGISLSNYITL